MECKAICYMYLHALTEGGGGAADQAAAAALDLGPGPCANINPRLRPKLQVDSED
jgi:hypothetical protein